MEYIATNEIETKDIGVKIAATFQSGDIICLYGELGAGKTTFVKGAATALGVKEEITSPTFTLMNVYNLNFNNPELKTLVHIDTYRLKNENELIEIGVEDYLGAPGTVTIIEWPEKITSLLENKKARKINFTHLPNQQRKIAIGN